MQTFLPYADFDESAKVLDTKRLGKQRVETYQVMSALTQLRLDNTHRQVPTRLRYEPVVDEDGDIVLREDGEQLFEAVQHYRKAETPQSDWTVVPLETGGWASHPVTEMWIGHERALLRYQEAICGYWTDEYGYKDTCLVKTRMLFDAWDGDIGDESMPPWLGDERFHSSHRSNLLRKKPEYYAQWGWDDDPEAPYYWPGSS